jgi:hypothetical protein
MASFPVLAGEGLMRTIAAATCFFPLAVAHASPDTLVNACALAAGVVVANKHSSEVTSIQEGSSPTVRLDVRTEATGALMHVECKFDGLQLPPRLAEICVVSTCYSATAAFESRRKVFDEIGGTSSAARE